MVLRHRPVARRRIDFGRRPMDVARAAALIQAAARGFMVRRRRRLAEPRPQRVLMSPMDIQRRFRRARRPQGQVVVPTVMPKARIGSMVGTEKSKRKVSMKVNPLTIKSHWDVNNNVRQAQVAYFGFPDAGDQDKQLHTATMALVNMFFRRSGMKQASITNTTNDHISTDYQNSPRLSRVTINYLRTTGGATGSFTVVNYAVSGNTSIKDLADTLVADFKSYAQQARFPAVAVLSCSSDIPNVDAFRNYAQFDLAEIMVDFSYLRKYKWQNITPAGDDRNNVNDIAANPLQGKIYQFKGPTPMLRETLIDRGYDEIPFGIRIEKQRDSSGNAIDYIDCTATRSNGTYLSSPHPAFAQPFKATQFLKNTLTEDKVYMPPGGYKQLIRKGKVTMSFKRFVMASAVFDLADVGNNKRPPKIGTCTLWGLEPSVRTDAQEIINVIVNSELHQTATCRHTPKKLPVQTVRTVENGYNFET